MIRYISAISISLLLTTIAWSAQDAIPNAPLDSRYFEIESVSVQKVKSEELSFLPRILPSNRAASPQNFFSVPQDDCRSNSPSRILKPNLRSLDGSLSLLQMDQIINLGQKIWGLIASNRPVVSAKTMTANGLPQGVNCWMRLENWHPPRSETYSVTYKNLYGMTVIDMEYTLIYTYGGQVKGVGGYLSNVSVQYHKLDVLWGFTFNANVAIPLVLNTGTSTNPVAGMQVSVSWSVDTVIKHSEGANTYFLSGDGKPTTVLN